MKVKCKKCGWTWNTKSERIKIDCPSCFHRQNKLDIVVNDDKEEKKNKQKSSKINR